jgi:hypothetical protein
VVRVALTELALYSKKNCQIKRYFVLESRFQAEFTTIFCTGLRATGYQMEFFSDTGYWLHGRQLYEKPVWTKPLAPNWTWKGDYNYYSYGEGTPIGPTLPRSFHANNFTLAIRYAF